MSDFKNYYQNGLNESILVKNNGKFSYNGPWGAVYENTVVERIFLGDFCAADFTIVVDLDRENKEIIKCSLVATIEDATITVYSRSSTNNSLANITARVNDSYVEVLISPATPRTEGAKFIYRSDLFQTQNSP